MLPLLVCATILNGVVIVPAPCQQSDRDLAIMQQRQAERTLPLRVINPDKRYR